MSPHPAHGRLRVADRVERCGTLPIADTIVGENRYHAAPGQVPSLRRELRYRPLRPAATEEQDDRGPRRFTHTIGRSEDVQAKLGVTNGLVHMRSRPGDHH